MRDRCPAGEGSVFDSRAATTTEAGRGRWWSVPELSFVPVPNCESRFGRVPFLDLSVRGPLSQSVSQPVRPSVSHSVSQ